MFHYDRRLIGWIKLGQKFHLRRSRGHGDTAWFFPDDPTNDEINDWLNDKVCDKNGNLIVGVCDVYTDQEIIDSVLARDDKDSFDFDEDWLIEEPVDESILVERFDEGREEHQKSIECVDFLIALMDRREDAAESIRFRSLRSKLVETEWQRRRRED
ncbi:uncharacterized protein LOC119770100 [Culex quinquefasciatus]|uniref:uncharacterized protein LOC119770100 n=1 Tax=Culex quinquefasciatus TaxID=7176 RepID=UPI0018E2FE5E|nr:uncharacterized protein LOC119770100 [Culex quinquefasciatus]XP_038120262.1 uncharacterized protein LOC119770100 [Culex quinquefasciatus]